MSKKIIHALVLFVAWSTCHAQPDLSDSTDLEEFRKELSSLSALLQRQQAEIQDLKAKLASQTAKQSPDEVPTPVARDSSSPLTQASPSSSSSPSVLDDTHSDDAVLNVNGAENSGDFSPRQPLGRFPDDAIVTAGEFDGSITIPGTKASVRIGGFVQLDSNFDFDSLGAQFSAIAPTIPLDGSSRDGDHQSQFHVRNSRVNIDYRSQLPDGKDFRTFVEWDFFGDGDEYANGYGLRLRHAAAQVGNFYLGQWWSNFVDLTAIPEAADLIGPLASPTARNPGIRYSNNINENWRYGFGLENPAGDLSGDSALLASDVVPNTTSYLQVTDEWGHLRLAGLLLRLESSQDKTWAGGFNFSGRLNLPYLHAKDNLAFALQAGTGFTHYYTGFSNRGLEGVVDSTTGSIESTDIIGGYLAYQHWWNDNWRSTLMASALELSAGSGSSSSDFKSGRKVTANLFWTPYERVSFGLEYIYAQQKTFGGEEGDGSRIHFSSRFDF